MEKYAYVKLAHAVLFDKDLSINARLLYAMLQSHSMNGLNACMPGVERLAGAMGVSRTTVWRMLNELENTGLVYRQRRMNNSTITHLPDVTLVYSNADKAFVSNQNVSPTKQPEYSGRNTRVTSNVAPMRRRSFHGRNENKKQGNKKKREEAEAAGAATICKGVIVREEKKTRNVRKTGKQEPDTSAAAHPFSPLDPETLSSLVDTLHRLPGSPERNAHVLYQTTKDTTLTRYPEATDEDINRLVQIVADDLAAWGRKTTLQNIRAAARYSLTNYLRSYGLSFQEPEEDVILGPIDTSLLFKAVGPSNEPTKD